VSLPRLCAALELDAKVRIAMKMEHTQPVMCQRMAAVASWRSTITLLPIRPGDDVGVEIDLAAYSDGQGPLLREDEESPNTRGDRGITKIVPAVRFWSKKG
jgi:hypothetical protein